jgi:hypothetical protein
MGSLVEELERREAAARAGAGRLRSRIEELSEELARVEEQVTRLVITREEVIRVLGDPSAADAARRDGGPGWDPAAWVRSAASAKDGISYWEVGNEVYGNGTYGANWETDSHCHTSLNGPLVTVGSEPSQTYNCGPAQYAAGVASFASAMHAADANAKVCAILTTPVLRGPGGDALAVGAVPVRTAPRTPAARPAAVRFARNFMACLSCGERERSSR